MDQQPIQSYSTTFHMQEPFGLAGEWPEDAEVDPWKPWNMAPARPGRFCVHRI